MPPTRNSKDGSSWRPSLMQHHLLRPSILSPRSGSVNRETLPMASKRDPNTATAVMASLGRPRSAWKRFSANFARREVSGLRTSVLLRSSLGALFEGAVHLLEATLGVGLKATGEYRDEHTLERFSLDETHTVLFQRLDDEGVLTIEQTRSQ